MGNEEENNLTYRIEDLPPELVEEIRTTFKIFDQDEDGRITTKELGTVLRSLGQNPTDIELQDLINQVDYNRNGVIEFDDFVDLMMRDYAHINHETDICNAFRQFNPNDDLDIDAGEVRKVLQTIRIPDRDIELFLEECSLGSSKINRDHFLKHIAEVDENRTNLPK